MRGQVKSQPKMFYQLSLEEKIPQDHPLRTMKKLVDGILADMDSFFNTLYSDYGAPSIPPEQLLKALLLQILFSIRSERQLVEQIAFNLLYQWFLDMSPEDAVWNSSTFSKNRDRLLEGEVATRFFEEVLAIAKERNLLSEEHFSVDGTLIEAWASMKSVKPKGDEPDDTNGFTSRNPDVDFKGQKRTNNTHQSTTDPEARLFKKGKGKETKLCFMGHVLMENRHGLAVSTRLTVATGTAEREAAFGMVEEIKAPSKRITLGGDKGFDVAEDIGKWRDRNVTPHFARKETSRIDERTVRHEGYEVSQRKRRRIEEHFGWDKTVGGMRKVRHIGKRLVGWMFTFTTAAYNLTRINNILRQQVA
jgi:transposase